MPPPAVVWGGASIGSAESFRDGRAVRALLHILHSAGVEEIDTAQVYEGGEELLGACDAKAAFRIDTKWPGGLQPGSSTAQRVLASAQDSVRRLGCKVGVFYIHQFDPDVQLSETLAGVDLAHRAGLFERFGLSNCSMSQVESIHGICSDKGYVLPTVYQGTYNAISRKHEADSLPVLRRLGMAFYAHGALAAGFLTKTRKQVEEGAGRFDFESRVGKLYRRMYDRPAMLEVLASWETIAAEAGCSKADLAYRWTLHHSALDGEKGDAILIGASSLHQVEQTFLGLQAGPLDDAVARKVSSLWSSVMQESRTDLTLD